MNDLHFKLVKIIIVCVVFTVGLNRFGRVHFNVASPNLRAQRLHFGHQLCDLKS